MMSHRPLRAAFLVWGGAWAASDQGRRCSGDRPGVGDAEDETCLLASRVWPSRTSVCSWKGQFIVTRLWTVLKPKEFSAQQVVDDFEAGFAPEVTTFDDFQAYLGATTNRRDRAFFTNLFCSKQGADKAQMEAQAYVQGNISNLSGTIEEFIFTEGQVKFQLTSRSLCYQKNPLKGKVLAIRTWVPKGHMSVSGILKVLEEGYGPVVRHFPGFQMYAGAEVVDRMRDNKTYAFTLNVFDTRAQANYANAQALNFVRGIGSFAGSRLAGLLRGEAVLFNQQIAPLDFAFLEDKSC